MREPPVILRDAVLEACELLDALQAGLGLSDRMHAYAALQAVVHAARDGLPASSILRLAAGMPLFVGGITVRDWHPALDGQLQQGFRHRVAERLPLSFPVPAPRVAAGVLNVLARRVDAAALSSLQAASNDFMPLRPASNRPQSGQP